MGKPMIPVNAYGEIKFWSTSKNGESRGSFDDLRLFLKTKKARTNLKLGLVWGFELPRELSELNFLDTSKWCLQGNKNKQCFQNITDNCNIFIPNIFSQKNESYFTSVDNTSYSSKFFQVFIRTFARGSHLERAKLLATTPTNTTFHFVKKRLVRYSLPRPKERNSQREATVKNNMEVVWLPLLSKRVIN